MRRPPRTEPLTRGGPAPPRRVLQRHAQAVRLRLAARYRRLAAIASGFGCPPGDMRLAYGWRAAVVTAALGAVAAGLLTRVTLTGLFVAFVSGNVVPVTGFNVLVTLASVLTLGLARARRFRLAVHHRLVPARRSVRRRLVRSRRTARRRTRRTRRRLASRLRRGLPRTFRRLRGQLRRVGYRRAGRRSAVALVLSLGR